WAMTIDPNRPRQHPMTGPETQALQVGGQLVAKLELRRPLSQDLPEVVLALRDSHGWSLLVVSRQERWREDGELDKASARVWTESHQDLTHLRASVEGRWEAGAWWELLEAGHGADAELRAAWLPERLDRDLAGASLRRPDLAVAAGYLDPRPLPAPGRADADWRATALADAAAHLLELGWRVEDRLVTVAADDPGHAVVGALALHRHGTAVSVVVRVDDYGEVFIRRAGSGEVRPGPPGPRTQSGDRHRRQLQRTREAARRAERDRSGGPER
ncbi:MAG: hypothetical protein ACRDZQ_07195, partial [Acidimicrobiales bacterium]